MDFSTIPLFGLMKAKMTYMSERQSVLAQNVANADTPHYRAKDIKEPDFKKLMNLTGNSPVQKLQMAATDAKHLAGSGKSSAMFSTVNRKTTDELNPNGNNVAIEEEMGKVGQNQAEYQKVLNLYTKTISMFKTVIGNPSSGG